MSLKGLLRAFAGNSHGGAAPMLALAALPLFGFVGAAVDFSRAASARTAMQSALDASALMLSKDAQSMTAGNLAQKADDYFKTLFKRPEATNVQVTTAFAEPQQGSFSLTMTGSADVNTLFSKMLGQSRPSTCRRRPRCCGASRSSISRWCSTTPARCRRARR